MSRVSDDPALLLDVNLRGLRRGGEEGPGWRAEARVMGTLQRPCRLAGGRVLEEEGVGGDVYGAPGESSWGAEELVSNWRWRL